jgi:hypothetical protein
MTMSIFAIAALAATQAVAPQAAIQLAAPAAVIAPVASAPEQATEAQPSASTANPPVVVLPAASAPVPTALVLWRNVESGMSVAQLRALYPEREHVAYKDNRTVLTDIQIIEGCQAKVNIMHPGGFVKEIVMRGEGSLGGRCSLKLVTALSGKYGEPLDKDSVRASILGREGKNYIWTRDGVTLQFKRYTNGAFGGGGLGAASWELRYATNASSIDL